MNLAKVISAIDPEVVHLIGRSTMTALVYVYGTIPTLVLKQSHSNSLTPYASLKLPISSSHSHTPMVLLIGPITASGQKCLLPPWPRRSTASAAPAPRAWHRTWPAWPPTWQAACGAWGTRSESGASPLQRTCDMAAAGWRSCELNKLKS